MFYYGAKSIQIREMNLDDIFLLRLKLLLRMTKDYLDGCTFSPLRRQAMYKNAGHIETESVALGRLNKFPEIDLSGQSSIFIDDYFYRSANELATLIKLIAKGDSLDDRQKSALRENFEAISNIQRTRHFAEHFPVLANSGVQRKTQKSECLDAAVVLNHGRSVGQPTVGLRA